MYNFWRWYLFIFSRRDAVTHPSSRIIHSTYEISAIFWRLGRGQWFSLCGRHFARPHRICFEFTEVINVGCGDNWVEFFIDESWGAVRTFLEFRSLCASQFPLVASFCLSFSLARSSPISVSLSFSIILSAASLKYDICNVDDKFVRHSLFPCIFVYLQCLE